MEGQGSTRFQLIPTETYSENFKRMVVREFERGQLNKKSKHVLSTVWLYQADLL
jgi:hypothetical protein